MLAATVTPQDALTLKLFGGTIGKDHCVEHSVTGARVIDTTTFKSGDPKNLFTFSFAANTTARVGIFLVERGTFKRALIVCLPSAGTAAGVLFGISHGFGQNDTAYMQRGYNNPLSEPHLTYVADWALFNDFRWAAQLLFSRRREMAFVMPVRAKTGHGELGPFLTDGTLTRQTLDGLAAVIGKGFATTPFDTFSFSSGIGDMVPFLHALKGNVAVRSVISLDPAPAMMAPGTQPTLQFLSGMTGAPKPGQEFLPYARWAKHHMWAAQKANQFNFLHNGCLPIYCLHLGLQIA
jgi:hypothetical protein